MSSLSLEKLSRKIKILADAAKYDASCSSSSGKRKRDIKGMGHVNGMGICHSYTPDGRCISLLKILYTNYCIYDCKFCINRVTSNVKREKFSVEEIVWLTLEFYRRNYIEGLFLSSGIISSPDETMDKLTAVARVLRDKHFFNGYIHLKAVAGSSSELIERAGRYADRVSANIEMPAQNDLDLLAPAKSLKQTTDTMSEIKDKISDSKSSLKTRSSRPVGRSLRSFAPAGQSTQMIVGASKSTDKTILNMSESLYQKLRLKRVYYSSYSPIPEADILLPKVSPALKRENRLYQADWLLRFYSFTSNELFTGVVDDKLDLDLDPKTAWAINNRAYFPVDINKADKEQLLRVPGIGVRSVSKILSTRKIRQLRSEDLIKIGVVWKKARFFVETLSQDTCTKFLDKQDLKSYFVPSKQLSFFDHFQSTSGEI